MNFRQFLEQYEKIPVEIAGSNVGPHPLVSVCVQTYRHGKFIAECLDNILNQKCDFEFEILLGEDKSDDGTREICIEYARLHPNIIRLFLHHRENNIRINNVPTGRFNFSYNLFSARGKYIAFCEGDDFWADPRKLQKQVNAFQKNSSYSLLFHDSIVVNPLGEVINNSMTKNITGRDYTELELVKGKLIPTASVLFKRESIQELPNEFFEVLNADTFLFAWLGQNGKGGYCSEVLPSVYRKHDGGMWTSKNALMQKEARFFTYSKLTNCIKREYRSGVFRVMANEAYEISKVYIKTGEKSKAWDNFFKGIAAAIRTREIKLPMTFTAGFIKNLLSASTSGS